MIQPSFLSSFLVVTVALLQLPAFGAPPQYAPDHVIVRYKTGMQKGGSASLHAALDATTLHPLDVIHGEVLTLKSLSVEEAIARANLDPSVEYAEPDWIVSVGAIPNDPRFDELYGLHNTGQTGGLPGADIGATSAWDNFVGDPDVMVGDIDTGIDYTHPDLAANIWTNPGEISGNQIDDDGNGYIDDVHGYDFANNDGDPMDDHSHGTHTSGTIAAVGNNGIGVVGVCWYAKIVGIKFLSASGSGSVSDAVRAIQYAITVGVKLTSNSWGGGGYSQALLDAIDAAGAAGQLFVAAAGNAGQNTDIFPSFPSAFDSPYIIAVAATDDADHMAYFTNYGPTTVDLGAPGVEILSTVPNGDYAVFSGTSMATPHVAGACALAFGRYPQITNIGVRDLVLDHAVPVPALAGRCVTGGRLNLAFIGLADDTTSPAAITDLALGEVGSTAIDLHWTESGDDGASGRARRTELRYSTAPIDAGNFASATLIPTSTPLPAGSPQMAAALDLAYDTTYFFAIRAFDEFRNASPLSNVVTATTLGAPSVQFSSLASVDLWSGALATQALVVSNTGQGRLDFSVGLPELLIGPVGQAPDPTSRKSGGDPTIQAYGNADAFGYRWSDSDQPSGPAYDWIDITQTGTRISFTGLDQNRGPFPLGFDFPFYGRTFSSVRVCTSGWISFTTYRTSYLNSPLPSTNFFAPENLIAAYWGSDLDTRLQTGAAVYYKSESDRFIVTWVRVPWLFLTDPNTFQIILERSGVIRFQYDRMSEPTNLVTIGIQDATKTIGSTIAFMQPYVHNGLAVRIHRLPQWASVSPGSGRSRVGEPTALTVSYDASNLAAGDYQGVIHVATNTPSGAADVPVTLHVNAAPHVALSPASIDFGVTYLGRSATRIATITNTGVQELLVSDIPCDDPTVVVSPTSFGLAPEQTQAVTLTYTPVAVGNLAATLTIHSNDPVEAMLPFAARGRANDGPRVAAAPPLGARLLPSTIEARTLRVANTAAVTAEPLDFTIQLAVLDPGVGSFAAGASPTLVTQQRGSAPHLASGGGPDGYGYRWHDSDEPGGPVYEWVDITGVGNRVDMKGTRLVQLGFDFPFYGQEFQSVYLCTNGCLSFTSNVVWNNNGQLPTPSGTRNLIAPFWDWQSSGAGESVYTYTDGNRFIASFLDMQNASEGAGVYSYQVILDAGGKIVFQYQTLFGVKNSCTVGIQDDTGTAGTQIAYNQDYLHNGLAIRVHTVPDWLAVAPATGSLPGQQSADATVTFNSTGLEPGTYAGRLRIVSNSIQQNPLDVPITLQVVTPTDAETQTPKRFALSLAGRNPARGKAVFMMAIPERRAIDVHVYDVRGALVRRLVHEVHEPGLRRVTWDGRNDHGQSVASGLYFVRMRATTFDRTLRVTLVR